MAEIELSGVSLQYGGYAALSDLSLRIREGEFLTLLGPSGCGKSTTLNLIAGLLEPTAGDIVINGRRVNGVAPRSRQIAMVFQDYALYPHMNVHQNLLFPLKAARVDAAEAADRIHKVGATLGLSELMERLPGDLSGGQRQRVALGRALVRDPSAFLMDEPLSNLDAKLRVAMRAELNRLHQRLRTTMVYVTHDQAEAMTLSDRIAVLQNGKLQQVGTARDVYERPSNQFVAGFVGSLGMNFVNCALSSKAEECFLIHKGFQLPISPKTREGLKKYAATDLILGVRPEHVSIGEASPAGISACVEVVEYLGSEVLVHLKVGEAPLIARCSADVKIEPNMVISIGIQSECVCLFDPATGSLVQRGL